MATLGPEGRYPLGTPFDRSDVGAMKVAFHIMKEHRFAVLEFGTRLNWFFLTLEKARTLSEAVRSAITNAFGLVPFDVSTLPLTVTANRGVVEIVMPQICSELGGNPEMWLALAHRIDDERRKLLY